MCAAFTLGLSASYYAASRAARIVVLSPAVCVFVCTLESVLSGLPVPADYY